MSCQGVSRAGVGKWRAGMCSRFLDAPAGVLAKALVWRTRQGRAARVERASSYQVTRPARPEGRAGGGRRIVSRPALVRQPVSGSGRPRGLETSGGGPQVAVDLTGDVTLQAADDLRLRQAFGGPPLDVSAGRGMRAHPGDHDPPQGVISLTVTTGIEAVPGDFP